ncbi:hypothetical protein P154DRAFT_559033 [Amniculicola lignicola CBS 123094]|uniref:Cytochrome oxidase c assembly domain-containing protein n=1 Tax=Amniculicola lignicola CBS 123094 TaxID=1392246 RepID=A0A6A5WZK6_9PLEO|nr:hypothetical protein P154DRAFT_559033 [Amniculicola lignicola CBS 123094]
MSRSPKDATRFTTTGVWSHASKPARSTTLNPEPAPKNETPQQKVKRLREAANRAKMAQVTKWDVLYLYGRIAADASHRAAVYGIVFATGCFGVLAVFSIGDMVVYNRRKRAIWFEQQEKEQAKILESAREAVALGTASAAQTALVDGIREEEEAMEKRKAERKAGSKILWWLHGEWNEDETLKEQRKKALEDIQREATEGVRAVEYGVEQVGKGVTQAVREAREQVSNAVHTTPPPPAVMGGPLDKAAASATESSKGWFGWITGGSKKSE